MSTVPRLDVQDRVATITLRRPEQANRLESDDLAAIAEQIAAVNAMEDVLVLRLKAEGRYFCSGYNMNAINGDDPGPHFQTAPNAIAAARPVTIAVMNGPAYGGATDLALACDFRLGVADMYIQVPAVRFGLHFYQSGLERFVSRLGLQAAKMILLTGKRLEAEDLRALGYLDSIAADAAALDEAVEVLTATLSGAAPLALLGMKKHLDRIAEGRLDVDDLVRDVERADASSDLREGLAAFREKRPPAFLGR